MVVLVTSDNEQFEVSKPVAGRSVLIKNMLEGFSLFQLWRVIGLADSFTLDVGESDQPIPLPNVSSSVLKKVKGKYPLLVTFC